MIKPGLYIGIMTGTSMDGIDICVAYISHNSINIVSTNDISFTSELRKYLLSLKNETTLYDISQLNVRFANEVADAVNQFVADNNIDSQHVRAIGFHGQTVWHQPEAREFCNQQVASTYQIGSAAQLAIRTGIDVVSDFRQADIALGGQGAPLIPIFDFNFLKSEVQDTIVLNIGGIANITFLPKACDRNDVIAFDTGPGNCLIDYVAKQKYDKEYDANGELAKAGQLDVSMLNSLMSEKYIVADYPKSTGKELFNSEFIEKHKTNGITDSDLLCTLTHFTAKSIASNIDKITKQDRQLIVAGGGANNAFLMELLEKYTGMQTNKAILDGQDITNSRESLLMAFLAYLRVNQLPANIPSVTGASREIVLGAVSLGK